MAKITYTDKDKNANDGRQIFTDANANEIKQSVNALYDAVTPAAVFSDLPATTWDLTAEGIKKTDTLTANTAISLIGRPAAFDGALYLVTNNNFTLTIAGTDITSKVRPVGETMIGIVWVDNISQYRFYTDYSVSTGTTTPDPGPTTPSTPNVTGNDTENRLFATHVSGPSVIYVSANSGAYASWTSVATLDTVNNVYYIPVGDNTRTIGYWKFKAIINGVESTVVDSPAFTSGVSVSAVYAFGDPGTDQSITVANGEDFRMALNQPFTVAVWLRETAAGAQFSMAVSDASQRAWGFDILGGSFGMNIFAEGGATYTGVSYDANIPIVATSWNRYLVTYDGSGTNAGISIFLNGNRKGRTFTATSSIATMNNVGALKIGMFPGFQSKNIEINNVLIEKYVFTDAEVAADYNGGNVNSVMAAGLNGDGWTFDNSSLNSIKGTHNGTATNPQFVAI